MNIIQLEEYFSSIELPECVQLNSCTFINDVGLMIKNNVAILKAHPGNKRYMPYYKQLVELKGVLEK